MGLRLKEQKGPRCAPHPWSQRAGDLTWEPSRLPGLEWVGQTPSSPLLLLQSAVWEGPSHLPLLFSPASLLCPQDQCRGKGRPLEGRGPAWDSAGSPCPSGQGNHPLILSGSSQRAPPTSLSCSLVGLLPMSPRTHAAWKELGGQQIGLGAQQAPCARVGGAITLCSSPSPPGGPLPPASPDPPSLPPMPPGPMCLDGVLEGGGLAWELSRLPGPSGPGDRPLLLSSTSQRVPPTCLS